MAFPYFFDYFVHKYTFYGVLVCKIIKQSAYFAAGAAAGAAAAAAGTVSLTSSIKP